MVISDVGKAESQPVSIEVMEVAQDEIARLQAENARLKATIEAQQRQLRIANRAVQIATENAEHWEQEAQRRGVVIERCEATIRSAADRAEVMEIVQSTPSPVPVHPPANVTHRGAQ